MIHQSSSFFQVISLVGSLMHKEDELETSSDNDDDDDDDKDKVRKQPLLVFFCYFELISLSGHDFIQKF